jgi:hypothetical protein
MNHELVGLDPNSLTRLYSGDSGKDTGIAAVANALRVALDACGKIDSAAAALKADKGLSPSGRVSKFREQERKLREPALAKINTARALVESKIKDIKRRMSEPPPPEDDAGLRRESNLIAAIRAMKPDQRLELSNNLDDEIAGAILRSHPVAIGMTASEQDAYRIAWQKKRCPDEAGHLNRNSRALAYIERAVPIITDFAEKKARGLEAVHAGSF